MARSQAARKKSERLYGKGGVFYRLPRGEGGPIEIRIDFGLVPPPPNYFYADAVGLQLDKPLLMALLSFGRRKAQSRNLAERIDIAMPVGALGAFWRSTRAVETTVDQVLKQLAAEPPGATMHLESEPLVTLFANAIHIAVSPGETSLDFYCLAPRDVHLARTQRREISLQPITRVLMSSVLAKTFFDILRPHAEDLGTSNVMGRRGDHAAAMR